MYEIEMDEISSDFYPCWQAAGLHLDRKLDGGTRAWLRAHPFPPFREHLSFRVGNQLFFVRVEDADGRIHGPSSRAGLMAVANDGDGWACILPMKKVPSNHWAPALPGWGLLNAESGLAIDPAALITDDKIEMTVWELQDMAVQIVRDYLEGEGFQVTSWQGNPAVNPSLWFAKSDGQLEWVVVQVATYPSNRAERPANWAAIAERYAHLGAKGHFASVALVSTDQPFAADDEAPVPLWRGHAMHAQFVGLE